MKIKRIYAALLSVLAIASASAGPREDLLRQVKSQPMDDASRQASLEWLYRYMPLPDITAHSPEFFRQSVDIAYDAVDSLGWNVPEREFRHFVLPLRINNEALDSSRTVFFNELLPRIKGLSMADAILEVNHWCHEKVSYRPSDPRTSTPLATVSNAVGRCGEESTFTVAALRAVGIPARQVYTTRWAHTDDNHAWVEAWADGKWWFLGACEPEPILNLAWFNEPASRGMLMQTKVFGAYDGPEEVLRTTPLTTDINITSNYAPTGTVAVRVIDADGRAVENADVTFNIYNYAQYFPFVTKRSDADGKASFICGHGDMVVWATDGKRFGFVKVNPVTAPVVDLCLDKDGSTEFAIDLDLVPPPLSASLPKATPEQIAHNEARKAREDSIRAAYIATFATQADIEAFAREAGIDNGRAARMLNGARGNHRRLVAMLGSLSPSERKRAVAMIDAMTEKDLCDITPEVVEDALSNTPANIAELPRPYAAIDSATYFSYVLSPRVVWEPLAPSRGYIRNAFPEATVRHFGEDPAAWVKWVADSIAVDNAGNPHQFEMRADAVMRTRVADDFNRYLFFVSGARAFGIPARVHPVTGAVEYLAADGSGQWIDVDFDKAEEPARSVPKASLRLTAADPSHAPKYFMHFSLSRIVDGVPQLMDFDDFYSPEHVNKVFASIPAGQYMLTTGQRLADGSVLARSEIFNLSEGEQAERKINVRHDDSALEVIGNFNSENLYTPMNEDSTAPRSLLSTTGRGFYVLGVIAAGHEHSAHALNDIAAAAAELEATGAQMVVLFSDADMARRFDPSLFPSMPSNLHWGIDTDGAIMREIVANQRLATESLPVFIVADTFNRVVHLTQGYTIGLGARLASILRATK